MAGKILILPFLLISIGLISWDLYTGDSHIILIIISCVLTVAAVTLRHWVDEKWYAANKLELGEYETKWLEKFFPYYSQISESAKSEFRTALAREIYLKEFIPMGLDTVPEEIKIMALAPAIQMGLHQSSKIMRHYNRIVFYIHPFITPNLQKVHISETDHEDGVLIFSIELLQAAYLNPQKYFNPALYEWSLIAVENEFEKQEVKLLSTIEIESSINQSIGTLSDFLGKTADPKVLSKCIQSM
jgi:hypothetical protein